MNLASAENLKTVCERLFSISIKQWFTSKKICSLYELQATLSLYFLQELKPVQWHYIISYWLGFLRHTNWCLLMIVCGVTKISFLSPVKKKTLNQKTNKAKGSIFEAKKNYLKVRWENDQDGSLSAPYFQRIKNYRNKERESTRQWIWKITRKSNDL